jgi:hypothetical protein
VDGVADAAAHVDGAGDLRPDRPGDRQEPRRAGERPLPAMACRPGGPDRLADPREPPQHRGRHRGRGAGHESPPRRPARAVDTHRRGRDHRVDRRRLVRPDQPDLQAPLPRAALLCRRLVRREPVVVRGAAAHRGAPHPAVEGVCVALRRGPRHDHLAVPLLLADRESSRGDARRGCGRRLRGLAESPIGSTRPTQAPPQPRRRLCG